MATTTPDQVFPSTAAAVQRLIGAAGCAAFDVQAVCAGFIYALNAADAMLRAGPYQRALVIGAETMSRVIDMKDRATCVLFGDGAGAVVLEASAKPGILAARMYADGSYDENVLGLTARIDHGELCGRELIWQKVFVSHMPARNGNFQIMKYLSQINILNLIQNLKLISFK